MNIIEKYIQYGVSNIEAQKLAKLGLPVSTLKVTSQKNLVNNLDFGRKVAKKK